MPEDINALKLQRLVDGAMSESERREFLLTLDGHAQHWREVALAFVEEQICCAVIGRERNNDEQLFRQIDRCQTPAQRRLLYPVCAAVVAAMLLMLCVGYWFGEQSGWAHTATSPKEHETIDNREMVNHEFDDIKIVRLQVANGSEQDGQMIDLPVYDDVQLQDIAWEPPNVEELETLNAHLADLGYRLGWRVEYLSGQLDDGRNLVVPFRNVALQYHGQ